MLDDPSSRHDRWARLRFAIIGPLLAAPPRRGQREAALRALAAQTWRHPLTEQPVGFGFSTIERWYYAARHADRDPVGILRRQRRRDAGQHWALSLKLREVAARPVPGAPELDLSAARRQSRRPGGGRRHPRADAGLQHRAPVHGPA